MPNDDEHLVNMLLEASNGLQMVSLVSHNSDEHLDKLEHVAEERVQNGDEISSRLQDRLNLLRSVREQQSEVIYLRFEGANGTHQLEAFAFELEDNGVKRLERIVAEKMKGAPPELAITLSDKLRQVVVLRRELKPIKDGLFRFLAANEDEARRILLDHADLLLTDTARHELSLVDSGDVAVRKRLKMRRLLWQRVYAEYKGLPYEGLEEEEEVPAPPPPAPVVQHVPYPPASRPAPFSAAKPATKAPGENVDEADKLMSEVYDLLDQAIGNAMVAFGIYRKNKSSRADEALKLLTSIHKEAKDADEEDD